MIEAARSALRLATSGRPPVPEMGLMITATGWAARGSLLSKLSQHSWCHEPLELARPPGRQAGQINPAHSSLSERQRTSGIDQMGRELAQARLVSNKSNAIAFGGA